MRKLVLLVTGLVLLGLGLLTVARFLDTGARWLILLASFSPYAVLGFLVVLLGSALAVRSARRRRWVVLTAVLAALGLAVQGWVLAPLFVGGATGRSDVTVLTSNLEFGRGDAATVVRTVASDGVDVLVLEEVTPEGLSSLLSAGLADLLPNRRGTAVDGAAGTMVFSRYGLGTERPFEIGNGGVDVQVAAPEPFRLLAVHPVQPIMETSGWVRDLVAIRDRAELAVGRGPTMVVGDFNATRDHEQLRAVLDTGLRDAAEESGSGWQPTWPSRYSQRFSSRFSRRPVLAIDHVLVTAEYQAISTRTVPVPGTDHLALLAKVRFRNPD
jgi:endonuclease/exonuclease/phosphatase (EEP) superfamily protein YafD